MEPLKISGIIEKLNTIKEKHGDIKVGTWAGGITKFIRSVKFIEATDYTGKICDCCAYLQWWEEQEDA